MENVGNRNNKRLIIDSERLKLLLSQRYTIVEIAKNGLLGKVVHPNTVHNACKRFGLDSGRKLYSRLTHDQLKEKITEINKQFPNSGSEEVLSHLKGQGIILQRDKCRELLRQVDPEGVAMRWAQTIKRRQYRVPTPNSLWHIDTHHKLIRWNFVTHGCIDGFSRLVSMLKVSADNLASTALNFFVEGIKEYGIPSRLRLDKGSEFVHVRSLMEYFNGEERGSQISGRSVHNQRIERLWRDVYTKVVEKYYKIFYHMEDHGILDLENPIHLYALQYTYLPRIQSDLDTWRNAHNCHRIRTENNKTPMQLWIAESIRHQDSNSTAMTNLFARDENTALEEFFIDNPMHEPNDIKVVLPRIEAPLTAAQQARLSVDINVLAPSHSHGIDLYGNVLFFIERAISE
ncbi:uncharacterized protein [Clytia hemisphaerica]|uniref:uncharacterized protein n=1 Tax=Clytia hemisphaerica TaxID=252671 RepID=UPI0034D4A3BA|eukprot:TCONS_00039924-protein